MRRNRRHRVLLMLDEFPALGRLDFFECALAFMAGYGIKSFLIAQSLNQIEKAYGANNSILDNCHVRVSFATNDERTAKRVSRRARHGDRDEGDEELCRASALALARPSHGLALRDRAPAADARRGDAAPARRRDRHGRGYTADPGEEGALLRGCAVQRSASCRRPIRSKSGRTSRADGWSALAPQKPDAVVLAEIGDGGETTANGGLRREPELPDHVAIAKETTDQKPARGVRHDAR